MGGDLKLIIGLAQGLDSQNLDQWLLDEICRSQKFPRHSETIEPEKKLVVAPVAGVLGIFS